METVTTKVASEKGNKQSANGISEPLRGVVLACSLVAHREPPTVTHSAGERGEEGVHRLFLGAFGCFETADALFRMLPR